jgi:hypothetical protein
MPDTDKHKPHKPTGQVRHEPGGRAVWQWAMDSGRQTLESTSRLLKKLDLSSMQFLDFDESRRKEPQAPQARHEPEPEPERPIPTFGGTREVDPLANRRQGFDPYNTRAPAPRTRVPPKPAAVLKSRVQQPAVPARKPGLFGRLFGSGKR